MHQWTEEIERRTNNVLSILKGNKSGEERERGERGEKKIYSIFL